MLHLNDACLPIIVLLFSAFSPFSRAASVNVTIDDTNGDSNTGAQITYEPLLAWQLGQLCTNCTAKIDSSRAYDGTWHDGTFYPTDATISAFPGQIISATAEFTGTAVYVYCILTRSYTSPTGNTDMSFYVDGEHVGDFFQASNGDGAYYFDQLVFSREGLDGNVQHSLRLESAHSGAKSLVLLDRIVYTVEDSLVTTTRTFATPTATPSTQSSSSTGPSSESSVQETTNLQSPFPTTDSSTNSTSASSQTSVSPGLPDSSSSVVGSSSSPTSGIDDNLPSLSFDSSTSSSTGSSSSITNTSESDSSNTGTIVGATLGSLGGLCLAVGLWWMCAMRSRKKEEDEAARAIQPFFASRSTHGGGGSVGGGLNMNEGASTFRGQTYLTFPATGNVGGAIATSSQTRTTSATTSSPITPTTLDTPNTSGLIRLQRMMHAVGMGPDGFDAGADMDTRPYAANVRSEKMRLAQAQIMQNQARTAGRPGVRGQQQIKRSKVSPFSPTQLYTSTNDEQSGLISPSTASTTMSTSESPSHSTLEGNANVREKLERIRRWNSTGRLNAGGEADGYTGNDWDDSLNATIEPVAPNALLRPNRRREPALLDDRPPTRPNPPPRPRRSRARPLTRISEINTANEIDSNRAEVQDDGRLGAANADSDEGSDVRWQRKLVDLFTPSTMVGGSAAGSPTGEAKKKRRALPTPPGVGGLPAVLPEKNEKTIPRPQGITDGSGTTRAVPTPPPPYPTQPRG